MNPNHLDPEGLTALTNALESQAGAIEVVAPRDWRLPGQDGETVAVAVDDSWIHFETPLACRESGCLPGPRRASVLLEGNTHLPEGMTYCVGTCSRSMYLIADVPVQNGFASRDKMLSDVQARFATFCSTLRTSPSKLASTDERSLEELHQPLTMDDEAGEVTRSLCKGLGWAYNERGNGQLAMTLEVSGQFCQAYAYLVGDREYRLGANLETPPEVSYTSRHAMATFLLAASRAVRMARAVLVSDRVASQYRWEVAWSELPTAAQFHCGLTALSVACRLTRRELQALCDESIAVRYLRLRRRSSQ